MRLSTRSNIGISALVVLLLVVAFVGYRFTQFGQVDRPAPGAAVQADQKPSDAYKPRSQ